MLGFFVDNAGEAVDDWLVRTMSVGSGIKEWSLPIGTWPWVDLWQGKY